MRACVQEEDADVDGIEFTPLRVIMHGVRADALAWSPESRLDKLPQTIRYSRISTSVRDADER